MYTEFLIIYIMAGVTILISSVAVVLQCIILKKMSSDGMRFKGISYRQDQNNSPYIKRGTVICRNCLAHFDAVHNICPKCGTRR